MHILHCGLLPSLLWKSLQGRCNGGVGEDAFVSEEVAHLVAVEDDGAALLDQELIVRGLQAAPVGDDAAHHVLEPDGGQLKGPQARLPEATVAPDLGARLGQLRPLGALRGLLPGQPPGHRGWEAALPGPLLQRLVYPRGLL